MKTNENKKAPYKKRDDSPKKKKNVYQERVVLLKPIDEVKGFFRSYFKNNSDAGHIMSKANVIKHVLRKLTAKEDSIFANALEELQKEGFIEILEDGVSLKLTQKGSDSF